MLKKLTIALAASAAALLGATTSGMAQTKLKWAHVYETSEPFHTASVWAAGEINKRTNGRYAIDVYPASQLGKETDINQGLSLGSVDMIISGSSFAAKSYPPIGVTYYPYTFRDAIVSHDPDAARVTMREHLARSQARFAQNFGAEASPASGVRARSG